MERFPFFGSLGKQSQRKISWKCKHGHGQASVKKETVTFLVNKKVVFEKTLGKSGDLSWLREKLILGDQKNSFARLALISSPPKIHPPPLFFCNSLPFCNYTKKGLYVLSTSIIIITIIHI